MLLPSLRSGHKLVLFYHYVINIDCDCWFQPLDLIRLIERVDLVNKALLHAPLVGGASVFRPKGMVM